ncbi:phosphotransferase family protein [[Mycobacterium] burgundiense]|uniref:Phosphotransferase family protein n=1 Tax=[Mycobacterium] burgundiense TaxID=3064286 RepID=A0ABM9M2T4_9MYCO|nr:phosphotransferase family protein [Mycolicibacterium sp. MU0053]CAJ1509253.1 phosphotransferase family protein [Mycolicibacterium sp. MU0053]
MPGGASSLTYRGVYRQRPVVVKVAPAGLEPIAHRDVLRQARILRALSVTDVPVPEVLWEDAGAPPEVPPLFVMSLVDGASVEPLFDLGRVAEAGTTLAARFRAAAVVLARLHRIDPASVGLGEDPVVGLRDEVDRWSRALQTVDPALVPGWHPVGAALLSTLPTPLAPAIVHGDFRLGNLLADADHINAVIDWEIWSLGDPRVDLGWFLINCDPATYRRDTPHVGAAPATSELAARYRRTLGRDICDLAWFEALACFKSAATWALIIKHNRRRHRDPATEAMAAALPRLLGRAARILNRSECGPAEE